MDEYDADAVALEWSGAPPPEKVAWKDEVAAECTCDAEGPNQCGDEC